MQVLKIQKGLQRNFLSAHKWQSDCYRQGSLSAMKISEFTTEDRIITLMHLQNKVKIQDDIPVPNPVVCKSFFSGFRAEDHRYKTSFLHLKACDVRFSVQL